MKLPRFLRLILLTAATSAAVTPLPVQAGVTLNPLWSIDPAAGSPVASTGNNERGIAYNPVSGNVLVCTRATADIFILNRSTGAILQEPEIGPDGLPTGNTVDRKLLDRPFYLPPDSAPAEVVTGSGTSGAVNLVGIAQDGVIYACNLVVSTQTNNFRIYRWESDGLNTAETNHPPYIAWPKATEENPFPSGNPDLSLATSQRWGDSMTVRGSGANTQIIVGSDAGAIAVFTTTDGVDFTPTFIPGALTAAGRGLAFGAGDTFYNKSNGGTALRRSSFTLAPVPATAVLNTFTAASASTNPMAVDLANNRLAMIDLTTSGTDIDIVRLFDISTVGSQPSAQATVNLAFPNANVNQTGAITMGDNKVFVCSTNKGIQAFSIDDDAIPVMPTSSVTPLNPAVWTRGQLTLTGSATGTPPLTYSWYKDDLLLPAQPNITLLIDPVTTGDAGAYKLRVTNAVGFAESAVVNVTTPVSLDTSFLTIQWQLVPGSRPWLNAGDSERGMDVNPATGRVYVASRAPVLSVQVLDAVNGLGLGTLDMTGISGGLAGIALNMLGVAGDGAIYACNLADDANPLQIYRWADDNPATLPEVAYTGNPIAGRLGDTFDVRGSGATTEIVIGSRSGDSYVIFKVVGDALTAFPITGTTAPAGSFGLGVAFGAGNEVWAKSSGLALVRTSFDTTTGTGTLLATSPAGQILGANAGFAFDPANQLVGISGIELSDSIRLYRVTDPGTGQLELLDQEFYDTDNPNINGVGAATIAGGKLYTLNTNNGLSAASITLPVTAVLTDLQRSGGNFSFTLTGAPNATYLIQRSPDMASWADDGTVVLGPSGTSPVTRTTPEGRYFFRARAR